MILKFDNRVNELYEGYFTDRLNECHVISGSYVPEKDSMLNALNVCRYFFFDEEPDISVEGDIGELPFEVGTVY